ncbi:MAG: hypothetical protein Q9196_006548 [Gyalolechia fulgens]
MIESRTVLAANGILTTAWNARELPSITSLWSDALRDTPAVQQILCPINATSNSQVLDLSTVNLTDSVSPYLEDALKSIVSDVDTFLAFAGEGRFAAERTPNVSASNRNAAFDLSTGLYTYVTSKLMQESTYFAAPRKVVERAQFEAEYCVIGNYSSCETDDGKVFYWSPTTHRPYELRSKSKPIVRFSELMSRFQDDGWANAQLLFDGAWNCTANWWAGGKVANLGVNGSVDASCLME